MQKSVLRRAVALDSDPVIALDTLHWQLAARVRFMVQNVGSLFRRWWSWEFKQISLAESGAGPWSGGVWHFWYRPWLPEVVEVDVRSRKRNGGVDHEDLEGRWFPLWSALGALGRGEMAGAWEVVDAPCA